MNKSELIDKVACDRGVTKAHAKAAVECVFDNIAEALARKESVRLVGFGTFGVRERAARNARNPRTGESISLPEASVPFFKAGKELKEKVNQ
ncbi:MAG: HU family DNA-binding protein [Candidatus Caldatribacteriota bacterium]|nr:HU family DNA-binding protein [Atribacterota bacterium]MDD3641447.1 HU family DNA-binding protein [Atribacterota bacterium]MDD4288406.1 HU family DNA-binding protein [Atribacterota bacterium]MDD4765565.1 HU family DNA-binding protein [Atribacterota bacterium]MDD5636166.1 HU family DNA-binding protein [Atribacterota bacterium]